MVIALGGCVAEIGAKAVSRKRLASFLPDGPRWSEGLLAMRRAGARTLAQTKRLA